MWDGENTYNGAFKWDAGKLYLSFELPGYTSPGLSMKEYFKTQKWGSRTPIAGDVGELDYKMPNLTGELNLYNKATDREVILLIIKINRLRQVSSQLNLL